MASPALAEVLRLLMNTKKVTLYIPAYNVSAYLEKVIAAVMKQTYPIEEVLVIDDGSTDSTASIAESLSGKTTYPLRLVRHTGNYGLSATRNTGFREAGTDFVASLDGDCVADDWWLASLMANFTDATIAGVGGKLIEGEIHCMADRWRSIHLTQEWGTEVKHNPEFLFGHSNVFRRAAVLNTGGYDEKLRTNGEDYNICKALYSEGYSLIYEPDATVIHLKTDSMSTVLTTVWRYDHWGFTPTSGRILKHGLKHLWEGVEFLFSDIISGRWNIIPITIVYPYWSIWKDIRAFLERPVVSLCQSEIDS